MNRDSPNPYQSPSADSHGSVEHDEDVQFVQIELEPHHLEEAVVLSMQDSSRNARLMRYFGFVPLLIAMVLLLSGEFLTAGLFVVASVALWCWGFFSPRLVRRKIDALKTQFRGEETTFFAGFSETALHLSFDDNLTQIEWRSLVGRLEGKTTLLLYISPQSFILFPLEQLPSELLQCARDKTKSLRPW